jgi:hypothetical protein
MTKSREKYVGSLTNETTFPGNTDRCHGVVASDHSAGKMGSSKGLDSRGSSGFQPILKDDETEETKTRLCLLSGKKKKMSK